MDTDLDIVRYIDTLIMSVNQSIADLKAALDARYASQTKALDAALAAAEKALSKADRTADRRFDVIDERLSALEKRT
jgi:hypothetical protein